jgi:hypothetical protein
MSTNSSVDIEYALHYLPVLGALMLSGHVLKGDTIDLPLPHPSVWPCVVSYIYTGKVGMTRAMQENILYLAGRISWSRTGRIERGVSVMRVLTTRIMEGTGIIEVREYGLLR